MIKNLTNGKTVSMLLMDTALVVLLAIITASQLFKIGIDSILSLLIGLGLGVAFVVALENWERETNPRPLPKPAQPTEPTTPRQHKWMVMLLSGMFLAGVFLTIFFGYLLARNAMGF
jgi:magnesium-transporting ATPase (P-type)